MTHKQNFDSVIEKLITRAYRCGVRGQKLQELRHSAKTCGPYYIYMKVKNIEFDAIQSGRISLND